MNYKIYEEQMNAIIERTMKETKEKDVKEKAGVEMIKNMIGVINDYVKKESESNADFDAALAYSWKNAERMVKYVWSKAREIAVSMQGFDGLCCFVSGDKVYDWITEYYFADRKSVV